MRAVRKNTDASRDRPRSSTLLPGGYLPLVGKRHVAALLVPNHAVVAPFEDLPAESQHAIRTYMKQYGDHVFPRDEPVGSVRIPMAALVRSVMRDDEIREGYASFADYHRAYMGAALRDEKKRIVDKTSDRWPVILSGTDDQTFEDGWHRFHVYYDRKLKKIPAIFFVNSNAR